jgi:hypothetical protein
MFDLSPLYERCSDLPALEYVDADDATDKPNVNGPSMSSAASAAAAHAMLRAGSRSSSASLRQSADNHNERTMPSSATATRREPFLPSINPAGCMSARRPSSSEARLNVERRSSGGVDRLKSSELRSVSNVWNGPSLLTDSRNVSSSLTTPDVSSYSVRK